MRALIHIAGNSGLKRLWARTRAATIRVLDQTTIADLCTPSKQQTLVVLKTASK